MKENKETERKNSWKQQQQQQKRKYDCEKILVMKEKKSLIWEKKKGRVQRTGWQRRRKNFLNQGCGSGLRLAIARTSTKKNKKKTDPQTKTEKIPENWIQY